ncbi:asparagine synthase (glutamine-hydrolyzing) [uncultured Cohaesibacter sp.]|uniref:asparagine synthase (glutamine-hydrolyzing) n=1 Tax=uncultured Cohaesibacter sp. TaxID=1002546 RepID=UPI0029C7C2C9|nr:asparagine synthase (glutamine-hydrolyzing) [uncultured Cohaesibacter sp.]
MCGFFQVFSKNAPIDEARFRQALDTMKHRGPDNTGVVFKEINNVHCAFGHQRLSILDVQETSNQPYQSEDSILLFNGEIYNFRDIAEELRAEGVDIHPRGDTEVLSRYLQLHGLARVPRMNGMWSFSSLAINTMTVSASRDRYGKKPLFFYMDDNILCLSSTARSIMDYLGRDFAFDAGIMSDFLVFGDMFPQNGLNTHLVGIKQVPPGHNARFDLNRWDFACEAYFDTHAIQADAPDIHSQETLADLLRDSLTKRLISDRPVGLLLSGGIDSSLVFSCLYSLGLHEQCKIFIGDTGRSDDHIYAKRSADQLGVDAEVIKLDYNTNAFERFLDICGHMEKPIPLNGSSMAMPVMYEAIAERGVPVVLDGTGGDEIFGGYWSRQYPQAVRQAVKGGDWSWVRQQLASSRKKETLSHLASAFMPDALVEKFSLEKTRLRARLNPIMKMDMVAIRQCQQIDPITPSLGFDEALIADVSPGGRLGEWLWHNDRNSMRASIEARSPILDYRLFPYIRSGYQNKFVGDWNKHELRRLFDAFHSLPTQWRKQKQGFRWDGREFVKTNAMQIIELIRENRTYRSQIDVERFCAAASRSPGLLKTSLAKRLLVVSALEAKLPISKTAA